MELDIKPGCVSENNPGKIGMHDTDEQFHSKAKARGYSLVKDAPTKTAKTARTTLNPVAHWREIRAEADKGLVYRYYRFVVLQTLIWGTVALVYVYFFLGVSQLVRDIIFFLIFVTIGITNYQSLWVATDYAKRAEPMANVYQKGGIFLGTVMECLEKHETNLAEKEGREPRTTEYVAREFGTTLITIMESIAPIQKQLKEKGITIEQLFEFIRSFMRHSDDISLWIRRFGKLYPLVETLASSIEKEMRENGITQEEFELLLREMFQSLRRMAKRKATMKKLSDKEQVWSSPELDLGDPEADGRIPSTIGDKIERN